VKERIKATALVSGGLDSTLAAGLMLEQGIEIEAVNCLSVVSRTSRPDPPHEFAPRRACAQLGIPLKVVNITDEFIDMLRNPKHGYGSSMNPCVDCRILTLRTASRLMLETGARFVVTGEVLGQRPMSQHRRALQTVDRESGLDGLVLRPLSAQVLEPTLPENEGWVDRSRLLGIQGRSRKIQMALAADRGITEYPSPAGGCLLTEKSFGDRLRDLWDHTPAAGMAEIRLLKYGRHFRLSPAVKIIVGRDDHENRVLARYGTEYRQMYAAQHMGPLTLIIGELSEREKRIAAAITARYGQGRSEPTVRVTYRSPRGHETLSVAPIDPAAIGPYRIPSVGR